MSGAVKRRNGEEEELGTEDHVGKVRKKEAGFYNSGPRPLSDNNHVCVSPHQTDVQNFLLTHEDAQISHSFLLSFCRMDGKKKVSIPTRV
jgi:hypothetical protein